MVNSAELGKLGKRLRELRTVRNLRQEQVAQPLGRTRSAISNWENGNSKLSLTDLHGVLDALEVSVDEREELVGLWKESDRGVGDLAAFGLHPSLRAYVKHEEEAEAIFEFSNWLVPGLLQAESYIRALFLSVRHEVSPEDIEKHIAVRLRRQKLLFAPDAPNLEVVITEPVLRLKVGDDEVLLRQLEHLQTLAQRDNISIRILQESVGFIGARTGFIYLTFPESRKLDPIGYEDGAVEGRLVKDQRKLSKMMKVAEDFFFYSASEEDSLKIIAQRISEMRDGGQHANAT